MDALLAQLLTGLDKGGAYALIALGLTLVFGTLGVVNFAHGALFMLGCFCAVAFRYLITIETVTVDPSRLSHGARLSRSARRWFKAGLVISARCLSIIPCPYHFSSPSL